MRNLISAVLGLVMGSPVMGQAGEVVCVGANLYGLFDIPDGVFTPVSYTHLTLPTK